MKTGRALSVLLVLTAAQGCKQSGTSQNDASTQNPGADGEPAEDRADAPAPVAGAYLSCLIAKPKPGDEYLNAGCQLRHPSKAKVDCKKLGSHLWSYVPPKGAAVDPKTKPSIEVLDLCNDPKKNYYFQVGMRMKLAKATGAGLALDSQRQTDANYFLGLRPAIVFNPQAKASSGLKLMDSKVPVVALSLLQEHLKATLARNQDDSPSFIPDVVMQNAAAGAEISDVVFDPLQNTAKNEASTVLKPTAVGSIQDVLPAGQAASVLQAEASGDGADAPPIGAPAAAEILKNLETVLDPGECAAKQPGLRVELNTGVKDAAAYTAACDAICGHNYPACTP